MALEASQQLRKFGSERPSHVFVRWCRQFSWGGDWLFC